MYVGLKRASFMYVCGAETCILQVNTLSIHNLLHSRQAKEGGERKQCVRMCARERISQSAAAVGEEEEEEEEGENARIQAGWHPCQLPIPCL